MKKICLLVFFAFFISTIARAENRADAATLTLGGGNYYFATKRHLENTTFPFIAVGYDFTKEWGIEGLLSSFNTDSTDNADNGRQVDGTLFAIDGLYHFSPYKIIQPFVMAGVGVLGLSPNGDDANNEGNVNAGVGAQIFLHQSAALRLEFRDFYTMVGGKNDYFVDGGVTLLFDVM